jgi:uncharacterized membrane protein YphA (DoxX/SURF4 family)
VRVSWTGSLMGYVVITLRAALAVVFLTSVLSKVRDRGAARQFFGSIRDLGVVPASWVTPVAAGILVAEAAIIGLLLFAATSLLGFVLAASLMAVFTVGTVLVLRRGVSVPCRCFGASTTSIGRTHLIRDLVLLVAATLGAAGTVVSHSPRHPAGTAVALGAGVVIALLIRSLDEIVELFVGPSVIPRAARPHGPP